MNLKLQFKDIWFSKGDLITTGENNPLYIVTETSYSEVTIEPFNKDLPINKEHFTIGSIWYKIGNIFLHTPPTYHPTENKHSELIKAPQF